MAADDSTVTNDTAVGSKGLERFSYDDKIVRAFLIVIVLWGCVAFLVGIIAALQLALPLLNLGFPFTSFGRLRPLHTNAAIFAFAANAVFAAIYHSTQRLCKARMFSDKLSWIHFWGWQGIILSAAISIPLGFSTGKDMPN
jgi:cytochrome c oxidase cbb3-type subunit I/II